ncbi:MAG: phenylalanine--tRNA ligase beta subunit-related protein [Bacteroidales bacterium]
MKILIDDKIREASPDLRIGIIRADVLNAPTDGELWDELIAECDSIKQQYTQVLQINARPAIAATRSLYKALGKDPNRYRVSSEALCRRIIRGIDIYRINRLVDMINLISIRSGYAIGGFDADNIQGETLILGVGEADEPFEAIGRGMLNIQGLPIYRDSVGGIGTPTSDNERTKITDTTTKIQMNINAFTQEMPLEQAMEWSIELLRKYASAENIVSFIVE